ncbi:Uncharacterised protein [Shigella sonnei]|nr:Uncharacterised protein [Shigella sonnei]
MRFFQKLMMHREPNILIFHDFSLLPPLLNYSALHFTAFERFDHFNHKMLICSNKIHSHTTMVITFCLEK